MSVRLAANSVPSHSCESVYFSVSVTCFCSERCAHLAKHEAYFVHPTLFIFFFNYGTLVNAAIIVINSWRDAATFYHN
jgi:hypothetical protein